MPEQRPLKIFLCYLLTDKPKVSEFLGTLKHRCIRFWLDVENLLLTPK